MTELPAWKKTTRQAKKTDHGCRAWMSAVIPPAAIPAGVKELRRHARNMSSSVAGTAIRGFMMDIGR